jgi:hypothetical protein
MEIFLMGWDEKNITKFKFIYFYIKFASWKRKFIQCATFGPHIEQRDCGAICI